MVTIRSMAHKQRLELSENSSRLSLSQNSMIFMKTVRSVYKELHADHETGAADNK